MENASCSRIAAAVLFGCSACAVNAASVEIGPGADVRAAITALKPGDELVLRGGTYTFNTRFGVTVVGTSSQPITIRGKDGETAVIEQVDTINQNVVEIQNSQYLVVSNLHFHGGSQGIRLMTSSFITIQDCEVYGTGDAGITANAGGTYDHILIRHNHIHDTSGTGEGMYLGCNNNACRLANSVIEWNHVHHTNGPTVEQGDGIEVKEGSYGNIIRHNVVHDTNYPGIITYSTVGNGPANIIDSNVIWNTNDNAIQSAADSIIRNNVILGAPISLQSHQSGSPSNQMIVHNTIITTGNGIEVRNVVGPITVANNAVYSRSGTAIALISGSLGQVTVVGNVGVGGLSGAGSGFVAGKGISADFVSGNFNGAPPIDVFPSSSSALLAAGAAAQVTDFDFNGTPRGGVADVGAYKYQAGGNPGWTLAAGFKIPMGTVRPNPPLNLTTN